MLPGPPAIYQTILNADRSKYDTSSLRLAVTGAAVVPVEMVIAMREEMGIESVVTGYGLTEMTGIVSMCRHDDDPETIAYSSGRSIPDVEVRIVDDDDNDCPPNVPGEFICRSNKMFVGTTGYYKKPEATLELFKNGWIHTGDIGRRDEDGYFYFADRKKQALRRRGENISSFEVEAVVGSHDAVLECAIVGVPSDVGEEEVKAVVVLKPGHKATPEELIAWCEPRMAYFAIPRYIAIRDSLPKTPSERVEKFKLKDEGVTPDCWDREKAGIKLKR